MRLKRAWLGQSCEIGDGFSNAILEGRVVVGRDKKEQPSRSIRGQVKCFSHVNCTCGIKDKQMAQCVASLC